MSWYVLAGTLKRAIIKLAKVAATTLLAAICILTMSGLVEEDRRYDIAVVLGNKIEEDGNPSKRLAARLDRAKSIYDTGHCTRILVSGGVGKEGFDEAAEMRRYLVEAGVSPESILVDSKGADTWQTALNTECALQLTGGESVIAVSQFFHLPRCRLALRRAGVRDVGSTYARYFEARDIYSTLRELPALVKYWAVKARKPEQAHGEQRLPRVER